MFFLGGGKCPNLGVGNVQILGVVNVRLANNLTPIKSQDPKNSSDSVKVTQYTAVLLVSVRISSKKGTQQEFV